MPDDFIEKYKREANEWTEDLQKYANCMSDIKHRLNAIKNYSELKPPPFDPPIETEIICLQFRSIFELITLSSLVANKKNYIKIYKNIEHQWRPDTTIKRIKNANPQFYPIPVTVTDKNNRPGLIHYKGNDFLTELELISAHGTCNDYLHASNPYAQPKDFNAVRQQFDFWFSKTNRLLETHIAHLAEVNRMIVCQPNFRDEKPPIVIFAGEAPNQ